MHLCHPPTRPSALNLVLSAEEGGSDGSDGSPSEKKGEKEECYYPLCSMTIILYFEYNRDI